MEITDPFSVVPVTLPVNRNEHNVSRSSLYGVSLCLCVSVVNAFVRMIRPAVRSLAVPAALLLTAGGVYAAPPEAMPSLQGYAGVINTPNARILPEGDIHLFYTDQWDDLRRSGTNRRQDNYHAAIGLFSFLELGARLTEAPDDSGGLGIRDLSASVKVTTAPFTREHPYWPVLAAGIQDIGGGANQLESRYVVLSEELWRFRFSAGYSFDSRRMDGLFGGVEFRAHDWITLLGEYDTRNTSAGIRLATPEIFETPLRLTATVKTTFGGTADDISIAAGLAFPLDFRKKTPREEDVTPVPAAAAGAAAAGAQPVPAGDPPPAANEVTAADAAFLAQLRDSLVSAGFRSVRTGQRAGRELVVAYGNAAFSHNELDALGVAAGIAAMKAPDTYEQLHLIIVRNGVRVAAVSAPLAGLRAFLRSNDGSGVPAPRLRFTNDTAVGDDAWFTPEPDGFPLPGATLILAPGLTTFVGTEAGVFDYLLSFRPELLINPWRGGVALFRWDIPVSWSSNLDDGGVFRGSRQEPRMDRAMLFQGVSLLPGLMASIGGGMILQGSYGTLNELTWSPGEGNHRLRAVQAWARDQGSGVVNEAFLGGYRYYHAPLDISAEVTGGRFWGGDRGYLLELKRYFADTAVSAYYKNSTTDAGKHWQAAGILFSFPLTPRRDFQAGPLTVRGSDEWSYSQETTLAIGGQKTNDVLSQPLALIPQTSASLLRSYQNRDRLGAAYLAAHADRLREAWQRFGASAAASDRAVK